MILSWAVFVFVSLQTSLSGFFHVATCSLLKYYVMPIISRFTFSIFHFFISSVIWLAVRNQPCWGSYLMFFLLPNKILICFFVLFCHFDKLLLKKKVVFAPRISCTCLCIAFFTPSFTPALLHHQLHFLHMAFLIYLHLQGLIISLFIWFLKATLLFHILWLGAIALSYPPYCYWWLIIKKRGWKLYRSPNPNPRGVRKCNSADYPCLPNSVTI